MNAPVPKKGGHAWRGGGGGVKKTVKAKGGRVKKNGEG